MEEKSKLGNQAQKEKHRVKFPPSRILVPVDGSVNSLKAAEVAARLAKEFGAELIVLSVIPMPRYMGASDIPRKTFNEYYEFMDKEARRSVDEVGSKIKEMGVTARTEVLKTTTTTVETITNTAIGEEVDLIVIGTRGLGGFKKLLLGSVSSGVVTHAACNVLVTRL